MFKYISVRASNRFRGKPIIRPHRTAQEAAVVAKMQGGFWREMPSQVRKNIGSGEDYAHH